MRRALTCKILPAILILLAFTLAFRQIRDADVGFHLKAGTQILSEGHVPSKDTFTYTITDRDYVDVYWLYQSILALANTAKGPLGMIALHATLVALSIALVWRRCREQTAGPITSMFVVFTLIIAGSYHFGMRPHILSWVFLNAVMLILERHARNSKPPLWLVPVLIWIWANAHTLFILGPVAVFIHLADRTVTERKVNRELLLIAALSLAVCFINPYGWRGAFMPLEQFGFLQGSDPFKEAITEYRSPFAGPLFTPYFVMGRFVPLQPTPFFHLFILLTAIAVTAKCITKRIRLHELLIAAAFTFLMTKAFKNIGIFLFALAPLTASGWGIIFKNIPSEHVRKNLKITATCLLCLVTTGLIPRVATNAYYVSWRSRDITGTGYGTGNIPVRAATFLLDRKLDGRLFNHINFGGFFEWFLPQPAFIDGRNEVTGETFFKKYMMSTSPQGILNLLNEYRPEIVVFPHRMAGSWDDFFKQRPDWRLVYLDDLAAIYLKNGYRDDVVTLTEDAAMAAFAPATYDDAKALLTHRDKASFMDAFFNTQSCADVETSYTAFFLRHGWRRAALRSSFAALKAATIDAPELYYNMGQALRLVRHNDLAIAAYRRYDDAVPSPDVKNIIATLETQKTPK